MKSKMIDADNVKYGTRSEISGLLENSSSILIVGDEIEELQDLLSTNDDSSGTNNKIDRLECTDIADNVSAMDYDCVIVNYDNASHEYPKFVQLLNSMVECAQDWMIVVVQNGQIMEHRNAHNGEANGRKLAMVDQMRALGFRVYGMSGPKQFRLRNGKMWIIPKALGKWLASRTRNITWSHPRQSYRLIGIKKPNEKISFYYNNSRDEMSAHIPEGTKRVLDIGCGAGSFGERLKKKHDIEVWGVEFSKEAAAVATDKLDKVINGDINDIIPSLPDNYFDCIVCNDVLEHLVDPYSVLANVKRLLSKQGVIVTSIPNVRHITVLKDLLFRKEWEYKDYGVLDRTHLRFFTKKSILRMFSEAGYVCERIDGINSEITPGFLVLNLLLLGSALDSRYTQYSCTFRPGS